MKVDHAASLRTGIALAALLGAGPLLAAPAIEFASIDAARAVLGARDEFVTHMSAFDRAARLEAGGDVSEAQYLAFASRAPLEWTSDERRRVAAAFAHIEPALSELLPTFQDPILLIKTRGDEEGDAGGYTRGGAVIVPTRALGNSERGLMASLAHEIFHVVSRKRPELRRALYAAIGFEYCGEVAHPASLAPRRITNPDAPVNDYCIRVSVDGDESWAVPILYSRAPRYDPDAGKAFFDYLTLEMLLVDRSDPTGPARPVVRRDKPVLVPMDRVEGFYEQVGRNTQYIIHPEEILASNFQLLVLGVDEVPSPEVLERIRRALADSQRSRRDDAVPAR